MKSHERASAEASATQLAAEIEWLAGGHLPASYLAMLAEPSPAERVIVERVQGILSDPRLGPFLSILDQHSRCERWACRVGGRDFGEPGRWTPSKNRFLLAPHLCGVLTSAQAHNEVRRKFPALDQPAAAVREDFEQVSAKCRALAKLMRQLPQPHVALAPQSHANEALKALTAWQEWFEASGPEREVVPFVALLERGADWFKVLAGRTQRATQNRRSVVTASSARAADLRAHAAEFLVGVFRKRLGQPYYDHVATIAHIASGIETHVEFVKQVEGRRNRRRRNNT